MNKPSLTVNGGEISGNGTYGYGINACNGVITIKDGTIAGEKYALSIEVCETASITGGSFTGSISTYTDGLRFLGIDEKGKGATFPNGITVTGNENNTLNAILATGAGFYDANGNLLTVDAATSLTGTVTVGCAGHTGGTATCAKKAECITCGKEYGDVDANNHGEMDETTGKCSNGCGNFLAVASVTTGEGTKYFTELQTAIDAAELSNGCTLTLENNITVEGGFTIDAGSFTLELNGKTLNVSENVLHALKVKGCSLVIQDSSTGEKKGSIAGNNVLNISNSTVELKSGELNSGVFVSDGTFIQSGGTVNGSLNLSGENYIISGGTIGGIDWHAGTIVVRQLTTIGEIDIHVMGEPMSKPYETILLPEGYALYSGGLVGRNDTVKSEGTVQIRLCDHSGEKVYSASENVITATCEVCETTLGTATVTAENATYDGTAKKTATVSYSDNWQGGVPTVSYENNTNAGTAAASISIGEATVSVEFTIAPKTLGISSVTATNRVFDGTNKVELSAVSVSGIIDGDSVSASATATIDSINAGEYSTVDLSGITLTGDAASNYSIAASAENVSLTVSVIISKADAPTLPRGSKTYVYNQELTGESISITGLPTDCGGVSYLLLSVSDDMLESVSVDANGKITYNVKALESYTEGVTATISVNVIMDNYKDAFYLLDVARRDKYAVTVKDGMSVSLETNELIYGQRFGELAFNEVTFVGEAGEEVAGTLRWEYPEEVPDVTQNRATWIFTPDSNAYKEVMGGLEFTVHQATPEVEAVPVVADRTYDPSATLADIVLSGGTVKDVFGYIMEGTWSWANPDIVPTVGNAGYEAVFTPHPTAYQGNYETVTKIITVNVAKATPYIVTNPTAGGITYGQPVGASALTGGAAQHSENNTAAVDGSFSWNSEIANIGPNVADSGVTEYTVTFTPADAVNYNSVTTRVTLSVAKAPQNISAQNLSLTYGDTAVAITVTGAKTALSYEVVEASNDNETVVTVDENGLVSTVNLGTAKIKITAANSDNYESAECEITVTVSKVHSAITVDGEGLTVSASSADAGDEITVTWNVDAAYVNDYQLELSVQGISAAEVPVTLVTGADIPDNVLKYTFVMPAEGVTVTARAVMLVYDDTVNRPIMDTAAVPVIDFIKEKIEVPAENVEYSNDITGGGWYDFIETLTAEPGACLWFRTKGSLTGGVYTPASACEEMLIPSRPVVACNAKSVTATSIVMVPVDDKYAGTTMYGVGLYEAAEEDIIWQTGNEFTGLQPNTYYLLYVKIEAKAGEYFAFGPIYVVERTLQATPIISEVTATGTYGNSLSEIVISGTASYNGTVVDGYFIWEAENAAEVVPEAGTYTGFTVSFLPDKSMYAEVTGIPVTLVINKATNAPDMPSGIMNVSYETETVGSVTLPNDWAWAEEDASKSLTVGEAVTATAVYNGLDKGNYVTETVSIAITRSACIHSYTSEVTKQPTVVAEGERSYTCVFCGYSYTEAIEKLKPTPVPTATPTPTYSPETSWFLPEVYAEESKDYEVFLGTSAEDASMGATLRVGEIMELAPYGMEEAAAQYTYQWHSSDESVATVDENGAVTMLSKGIAIITLELTEKETGEVVRVAPMEVGVPEADYDIFLGTSVRKISLRQEVKVGERIDLNFYGVENWKAEDYTYEWMSADDSIAKAADAGVVVGCVEGKTVVRLKLTRKATGEVLNVAPMVITVTASEDGYNPNETWVSQKEYIEEFGKYDIFIGTSAQDIPMGRTLSVGESVDLSFYGVKNWRSDAFIHRWKSSDESIATVAMGGIVTMHAEGVAIVSLEITNKETGEVLNVAPVEIGVPEADYDVFLGTSAKDVQLRRELEPGSKLDLNFYGVKNWVGSDYTYEWISSDESVATVAKAGVVTAHKAGKTVIRLKLKHKQSGEYLVVAPVVLIVPEIGD